MISSYMYEDIHKCNFCKNFIESNYCQMIIANKKIYYHPICYDLLKKKIAAFI